MIKSSFFKPFKHGADPDVQFQLLGRKERLVIYFKNDEVPTVGQMKDFLAGMMSGVESSDLKILFGAEGSLENGISLLTYHTVAVVTLVCSSDKQDAFFKACDKILGECQSVKSKSSAAGKDDRLFYTKPPAAVESFEIDVDDSSERHAASGLKK